MLFQNPVVKREEELVSIPSSDCFAAEKTRPVSGVNLLYGIPLITRIIHRKMG